MKISEFRAKKIIYSTLGIPYNGISVDGSKSVKDQIKKLNTSDDKYVIKVDQGVKGRYKKGLIALDISSEEVVRKIEQYSEQGYRWFLVESMTRHNSSDEKYLSISRERSSVYISLSSRGGINVEKHTSSLSRIKAEDVDKIDSIFKKTGLPKEQLLKIIRAFDDGYMSFLEINPYILIPNQGIKPLDIAIEVDSAGAFFTDKWSEGDFREFTGKELKPVEQTVRKLAQKSPASFKLDVINPDGSIFLLLSGGGASIVIADEFYNRGLGGELANYGEYSGNPNSEETQIYASAVLQLLLNSKAPNKILFIGGAVANFTDISNTFKGIIKSIDMVSDELQKQTIKVFVRRGGPRQEIGLTNMEKALENHGVFGAVHDAKISIPDAVKEAIEAIS